MGLCHSVANTKDLGDWVGATAHGLFAFPPGTRPVPLEIHVQGFDITNFEARMQVGGRAGGWAGQGPTWGPRGVKGKVHQVVVWWCG